MSLKALPYNSFEGHNIIEMKTLKYRQGSVYSYGASGESRSHSLADISGVWFGTPTPLPG